LSSHKSPSPEETVPNGGHAGEAPAEAGDARPDPLVDPLWPLAIRCGFDAVRWQRLCTRARNLAANPFDLAIGEGSLHEARFVAALAASLHLAFEVDPLPPAGPVSAEEAFALRAYAARGPGGGTLRVLAPDGAMAARLLAAPPPPASLRLTTRQALLDRLIAADREKLARSASFRLPEAHSARHRAGRRDEPAVGWHLPGPGLALVLMLVPGLAIAAALFPAHAALLTPLVLAPVFILAGLSALTATFESRRPRRPAPPVATARLPRYSLLVPLYGEANIVEALVENLRALLYPRDRIEVFLIVEEDDAGTIAALARLEREAWMMIFKVPAGTPRTKPRALNAALGFASGDLVVVYDAEDQPEPDQLLRAAALFGALPADVACLQGRLAIANVHDGFLTRRFAIDYAALFDCMKAGMGRAGWAVPLGGSSNHFRAEVLKRIGAWDAWNVTEDADLGLRLARFGWRVEDLASTTWEEAPDRLSAWMNQRTRWMKGWLQTLIVHARRPAQMIATLGLFRTMILASTGVAVVIGALLYPVFMLGVALRLADPVPLGAGPALLTMADTMLVFALVVAALVETIPALVALRHRGALALAPYILLAPVTHLMVSFAAWRALVELVRRPFYWHKTAHGLSRRAGGQ
jgi:glycosyltransferase XagB